MKVFLSHFLRTSYNRSQFSGAEEEAEEESYRRGLGKIKADDPRAALYTTSVAGAKNIAGNELDDEELHFTKPVYHVSTEKKSWGLKK